MTRWMTTVLCIGVIGTLLIVSGCSGDEAADNRVDKKPAKRERTVTEKKPAEKPTEKPGTPAPETGKKKYGVIETAKGKIVFELYPKVAPKTVANFEKLANDGFYNGTKFHRVIADFMIQGGDPNSKDSDTSDDGEGGPGYTIPDEFNELKHVRGTVSMAKTPAANSGGSQFFIVTKSSTPWLDGKHTIFGQLTEGMDIIDMIVMGDVMTKVYVEER